ncbi:MAG: hypothetical protein GY711_01970, partial [bacterium]|nr:hypothetical protein [bacterium]
VFTKRTADPLAKLVYDNCGANGARSILWDADEFGPGSPLAADLFVQGRAHVSPPEEERLELSVLGDVTIDPFARLSADSFGLAAGPGVGSIDPNQFGSGGSHGGSGHTSSTQLAPVGPTYGSIAAPLDFGSGGGGVGGGRGGGALRLWVAGTLTIEGIISADGQAGNADSGGGSGGSIWITTQVLAGDGVVAADGGVRHSSGGCGGGGRVAVYFDDQLAPPATLRACGGPIGAGRNGGAGSVFTKRTADPLARLIYDNCLTNGAPTEIWSPIDLAADLVLRGRASLSVPRANGNGPRALVLALDGSATIEAESSIVVDARGWPAASGPGMGASLPGVGGGAGHGGPGAQSCGSPPAGGGGTYGQLDFPTDFGSGGGWSGGGAGGGALFLTLGGDLFLHGDVHANGEAATSNSGGGSGGSVLILANDVIGTFGVITANGGVGQSCGGGGGGGRVAILTYCPDLSLNLAFVAASGSDGGSDGSVFVGTILPPNANLTISSSDPASAFPVSAGSLAQEIMLLGAGPPPPGPGWMTAFRHNDFHTASAYQCPALGILETTGSLAEVTPPSTLDHNQYESDTEIRVFAERIEHVLSAPLAVDVENPVGSYSNSAALMPSTLAAGTVVNSHLLHFDTVQANQVTLTGSVTFDSRITGVILLNSTLDASDPELAVGTTTYPTGLTGRELEIDDPTDFFMVSPDGKTLSISSRVRSWMDEVRILTEVPDPIALPYVDPETFMPGVDEVSSGDCGSAFYRFTFELPPVFDNASLFGIANVDDQAVVFLNGTPISGAMTIPTCEPDPRAWPVDLCYLQLDAGNDRTDPSGRAILTWPTADCFITANSALFVPGTNELVFAVCGDASFWDPTGVEFSAVVRFD